MMVVMVVRRKDVWLWLLWDFVVREDMEEGAFVGGCVHVGRKDGRDRVVSAHLRVHLRVHLVWREEHGVVLGRSLS